MKTVLYTLILLALTQQSFANVEVTTPADRLGASIVVPIERHTVAVVDDGFDLEHINLRSAFFTRLFANSSHSQSLSMRFASHGHSQSSYNKLVSGTASASIIAGRDGLGLYPKAKILPIDTTGSVESILKSALIAYTASPYIAIDLSLQLSSSNKKLADGSVAPMSAEAKMLFQNLLLKGVIIFMSAGIGTNHDFTENPFGADLLRLAQAFPNQIVIANNAYCDQQACEIDPITMNAGKIHNDYLGVDARKIKVAYPNNQYSEISGTAAASALLLGAFLNLEDLYWTVTGKSASGATIVEIMKLTAQKKDMNNFPFTPAIFGKGLFNYKQAEAYIYNLGKPKAPVSHEQYDDIPDLQKKIFK